MRDNLVNQIELVSEGACWREERTGLHSLEFIETRRHWFTGPVPHATGGSVNVLNLVEGSAAVIDSPYGAFRPLVIHYGETVIVPAAAAHYVVTPLGEDAPHATVKASVRDEHAL